MTETTASNRTSRGLSAPVLIGGAFLLTTVVNICFQLADILFTDRDPYRHQGPVESIASIAVAGTVGLIISLAAGIPLVKHPAHAKTGAIVFGALAVITAPFFWSGAPAVFGTTAAWLAGLTKGSTPQTGAARGFGIIGFVIAVIVVVAVLAGDIGAVIGDRLL